ncbi:MAG: GDSL-type esterase/lipase family protein [Bacteroidales bacterium]
MKRLLFSSITLLLCAMVFAQSNSFCHQLYPDSTLYFRFHQDGVTGLYHKRIKEFKQDPLQTGDIVIFGGTIVEKGGNWAKRLAIPNVKNRGIDRDVSYGLVTRSIEIICAKPKAVVLQIGTDDLWRNILSETSPSHIVANVNTIAKLTKHYSAETKLIVLSATPGPDSLQNVRIREFNTQLKEAAESKLFTYVDLAPKLQDKKHNILKTFSKDGVHLNEAGYKVLCDVIKPYIK